MDWYTNLSPLNQALYLLSFAAIAYFGIIRPGLSLAPWVPTFRRDLDRVNKIVNLKPGDTFLEAGCGNARVTIYIAKNNPEANIIGVEYSFLMFVWAKVRSVLSGLSNLTIRYGDALKVDVSDMDVVYTYGLTDTVNEKLLPKMKQELRPGSRFISYAFTIEGDNVAKDVSETSSNIYIYTQPTKS